MVKFYEIANNKTQQPAPVMQPSVIQQQTRTARLMQQMAADDAQQEQQRNPTGAEVFVAMTAYKNKKTQTDLAYAQRLRQQLAIAQKQAK